MGTRAPRRIPKWFNWLAGIVIVFGVLSYLTFRELHAAKKLALIRKALADYAANVQTYEGRCEGPFSNTPVNLNRSVTGTGKDTGKTTYEFAADMKNRRMALETREVVTFANMPGTSLHFRRATCEDGVSSHTLTYSRRAPQEDLDDWGDPHLLMIGSVGSGPAPAPWYLVGLVPTGRPNSLVNQFEDGAIDGKIRYDGLEQMNGAMCERVTIDYGNEKATYWFDPACDYLPRRQKLRDAVADVFEFQQYRDEVAGLMRWFPSRGRYDWGGSVSEFNLTELKINPVLSIKRFQIAPESLPDGVKVQSRETNYTGGREDLWKERDEQHENGMRALRSKSTAAGN